MKKVYKNIIIGSGPSGYVAGIYSSRANLNPLIIEGPVRGGQLTTTTEVENFPGYPGGVSGTDLVEDIRKQAESFNTEFVSDTVTNVIKLSNGNIEIETESGTKYESETVIISTGATAKYLGLDNEQHYLLNGGGVSACATCDGFFYSGEEVSVIGGGDTALEEAIFLSNMCKKVNIIVRSDKFKASKIMIDRAQRIDNIEIHMESKPIDIIGNGEKVHGVKVLKNDVEVIIPSNGVFIAIGHTPNTTFLSNSGVELDSHGYIITAPKSTETNVPGIFACGDVADNKYRQAITAAGTGCMSAMDAEKYLMQKN